jgi:hypothetical protein
MNYHKLILILSVIASILSACNGNKLKTDEKALTEQILTEEEKLAKVTAQRDEREKQLADSIAKLPKGFQFPEVRNVDTSNPPMIIDIANSLDNVKDLSLSGVASSIEYIRMESVPDSTLLTNMKYKYYLTDNYIVATNIYGIQVFKRDGSFKNTVVKNSSTGITYDEKKDRLITIDREFGIIGGGTSPWFRGNKLYYTYSNTFVGQAFIMEYDLSSDFITDNNPSNPENQNKIVGSGKAIVDLNSGRLRPYVGKGNGSRSMDAEFVYSMLNNFSPDGNTIIRILGGKYTYGIYGNDGRNLTAFKKFEQVENYTKNSGRGTDYGVSYIKEGNMLFRSEYNDTVFQVIPPNRILPKYVLNLGQYKTSKLEGMDPDVSLKGKIIPLKWADNKNYIFLTYAKDSYDCPNTRLSKTLQLYHAVFNKLTQQLSILTIDPTDYEAPILKNDIDGGVPVWPSSYMIGKNGEILISLTGKELKAHVASKAFQNSAAPVERKAALKQLALQAGNDEQVLMIVK